MSIRNSAGRPESVVSDATRRTSETGVTSYTTNHLQVKGLAYETSEFDPIEEAEPGSYDLLLPVDNGVRLEHYSLEERSRLIFSHDHLQEIFADPSLLLRFTAFLSSHRPESIPMLIYYLDSLKALKAIAYANAITGALDPVTGHDFTKAQPPSVNNAELREKISAAFDVLVRSDLPAYVTHLYINVVSSYIGKRIAGTLPRHLHDTSEGLAEVFCLSDPARDDNPIVFASEEFLRTTQYGMGYSIGRNCRFLQGPHTDPYSTRRLRQAVEQGREHSELLLNYRRDGSPFMNLLMIAPLMDAQGKLRYFIGAQVDVSGLVRDCAELEGLRRLVEENKPNNDPTTNCRDEFQALSEMFNMSEIETVRIHGGGMHQNTKSHAEGQDSDAMQHNRQRLMLKDLSDDEGPGQESHVLINNGKLSGIYSHYLLVRPHPSLRVLFASPTLRIPGMLQSRFMDRIGGSQRVRDELSAALADGRGVTARIRWISRFDDEGRPRWVHCTPLMGANRRVGVWMVVLVDDSGVSQFKHNMRAERRFGPGVISDDQSTHSGLSSRIPQESGRASSPFSVDLS